MHDQFCEPDSLSLYLDGKNLNKKKKGLVNETTVGLGFSTILSECHSVHDYVYQSISV